MSSALDKSLQTVMLLRLISIIKTKSNSKKSLKLAHKVDLVCVTWKLDVWITPMEFVANVKMDSTVTVNRVLKIMSHYEFTAK